MGPIMLFPAISLRRTEYYSDGIGYMAGDMLVRIAPDGTQTTLTTLNDILIDEVKTVKSGAVRFTIAIPTEGHRSGHYTCLLKDGRITVRSAQPMMYSTSGATMRWKTNRKK